MTRLPPSPPCLCTHPLTAHVASEERRCMVADCDCARYEPGAKARKYHNEPIVIDYEPRGAARTLFASREEEVVLSGPAGTGKTRGCLEKVHLCASKYDGMRALILRKSLSSLTATALVTYRERVLHPLDAVHFFNGSKERPAQTWPREGAE